MKFDFFSRPVTDAVVIESNAKNSPQEVKLQGKVTALRACQLEPSLKKLDFGSLHSGFSKTLSLEITNKGWENCITDITVKTTAPLRANAFHLKTSVQNPVQIGAGATLKLEVVFQGTEVESYKGALDIAFKRSNQATLSIPLAAEILPKCLDFFPTSLSFGNTKQGCSSRQQTVTIASTGDSKCVSQLTIASAQITPGLNSPFRLSLSNPLPFTLTTSTPLNLTVSYKPTSVGNHQAAISLNTSGSVSLGSILLSGTGTTTANQQDVFTQPKKAAVDMLFVIDDSCSMSEEQGLLSQRFDVLLKKANALGIDYHIGVTTTDVTGSRGGAGARRAHPSRVQRDRGPGRLALHLGAR